MTRGCCYKQVTIVNYERSKVSKIISNDYMDAFTAAYLIMVVSYIKFEIALMCRKHTVLIARVNEP
jgi:hypothetical protein